MIRHYRIHEVSGYINWVYFFHAWGFQPRYATIADIHGCDACRALWLANFPEKERAKAAEAMQLFKEANRMLSTLDKDFQTHALFLLADANSLDNDIWIEGVRFPFLRQQTAKEGEPYLCLSDFIRPLSSGIKDKLGLFATSVDAEVEKLYPDDSYRHMLVQTLADRLAEATAEKLHETIRKETRRVLYGMERKTRLKCIVMCKYTRSQTAHRYNALKRGYIIMEDCTEQGGERYNIYYDNETERAPIFEKNLLKDGFHLLRWSQ